MNILVLIQRRSLIFYYSNRNQPLPCAIPETVMNDLEILNEQELHTIVGKYIPPVDPKAPTQAMLLLNDETCFSSWLEAGKEDEVKKTMIEAAPFTHTEGIAIPLDPHTLFITTNKDLYTAIGRALESYHCMIVGVYPWVIANYSKAIKEGEPFSSVVVERLFEAQARIKECSFPYLTMQAPSNSVVEDKTETKKKPLSTGLLIFLIIAGVYAIGMAFIFIRK
jgi:hypothetical protein